MSVANMKIEPMDVYLGTDVAQVQKVTCLASSATDDLNSTYFILHASTGVRYAVWFDVNSTGVDPAVAGYTSVEVDIAANPVTADAVATAVQGAVDALGTFSASVSGSVVTVTDAANGPAAFAHDSQAAKTGFAFEVETVGDLFEKIGFIDGDISASGFASALVDLNSHQTGTSILGQIPTAGGGNPELSFALKEVTYERYNKILRYRSGPYYPVENASTPGIGGGSLEQFKCIQNAQLVLHPVRLGLANKNDDYCFWRTVLDLDSITFSGETVLTLPITAMAFKDDTKAPNVDVWMYGDWSQNFTK